MRRPLAICAAALLLRASPAAADPMDLNLERLGAPSAGIWTTLASRTGQARPALRRGEADLRFFPAARDEAAVEELALIGFRGDGDGILQEAFDFGGRREAFHFRRDAKACCNLTASIIGSGTGIFRCSSDRGWWSYSIRRPGDR